MSTNHVAGFHFLLLLVCCYCFIVALFFLLLMLPLVVVLLLEVLLARVPYNFKTLSSHPSLLSLTALRVHDAHLHRGHT